MRRRRGLDEASLIHPAMKTELLLTCALIGILTALSATGIAHAVARGRNQIRLVKDWSEVRLDVQLQSMDYPESDDVWEPVLEHMNSHPPLE